MTQKIYRPFWIPDESRESCTQCKSKFSAVLRRHHCRSCGNLYCNICTERKQSLPHLHYTKPVRICNNCDDLVRYLKLSQSFQISDKIESSKGFCQASSDSESKKMIIKCYLETFYFLITDNNNSDNKNNNNNSKPNDFNNSNKTIFKYISKAIANLSTNEYFRSDLIESNLLQPLVNYLIYQFKDPSFHNQQYIQLQSPSINQIQEDLDMETLLNVFICLENLACIEHPIVKEELGEKCLPRIIELSKLPFSFEIKHSISTVLLNLTKNTQTREYIMQHNTIQAFLMNSLGDDIQESCAEGISILSSVSKYHRKIVESGALPPLILMLSNSNNDRVIEHTTMALSNLSMNQENQLTIAKVGCINPLIKIITEKNYFDLKILINTLTALYNLSLNKLNCPQIIQIDLIDSLSKIVISNYNNLSHELLHSSLKILGNLSNEKEAKFLIKNNPSMMSVLRIMIHTTNKLQYFASIIYNNCEPPTTTSTAF